MLYYLKNKSPVALLIITILCYSGMLAYLWSKDTETQLTLMKFLSWDEFQYLIHINKIHMFISDHDFTSMLKYHDIFGYSDLFWQTYAFISYPFRHLYQEDNGYFLYTLRLITLSFIILCIYLAYKITIRLGHNQNTSSIFLLLIIFMPGLYLLYKPFSPDYFGLFFILLTLLLCTTKTNTNYLNLIFIFFFFGIAISVKIYNILLLPYFFLYVKKQGFKNFLYGASSSLTGILLSNVSIFYTGPQVFIEKYITLSSMAKGNYQHAIPSKGFLHQFNSWFINPYSTSLVALNTTGINAEYFSYSFLLLLAGITFSFFYKYRRKTNNTSFIFLIISFIPFISTIILTNRVWTWYLIPPIFILTIEISKIIHLMSSKKVLKNLLILLIGFHLLSSIFYLVSKSKEFINLRNSTKSDLDDYYINFVNPVKTIISSIKAKDIISQYTTPISPDASKLVWSDSLNGFINQSILVVTCQKTDENKYYLESVGFKLQFYHNNHALYVRYK